MNIFKYFFSKPIKPNPKPAQIPLYKTIDVRAYDLHVILTDGTTWVITVEDTLHKGELDDGTIVYEIWEDDWSSAHSIHAQLDKVYGLRLVATKIGSVKVLATRVLRQAEVLIGL